MRFYRDDLTPIYCWYCADPRDREDWAEASA